MKSKIALTREILSVMLFNDKNNQNEQKMYAALMWYKNHERLVLTNRTKSTMHDCVLYVCFGRLHKWMLCSVDQLTHWPMLSQ